MAKGHSKKKSAAKAPSKTQSGRSRPAPSKAARARALAGGLAASDWAAIVLMVVAALLGVVALARHSGMVAWTATTLAWLPFAAAAAALVVLPPRREVRTAAIVVVVLAALLPALLSPAQLVGDANEYLQMTGSLMSHATPDLRPADSTRFAVAADEQHLQSTGGSLVGRKLDNGYFSAKSGAKYSYHFWLSALAAVPFAATLALLGIGSLKAFQVMNAVLFVVAFLALLLWADLPRLQRQAFAAFWAVSPAIWYIGPVSAEAWSASWSVLGIVFFTRKRYAWAVFAVSMGAAQNPPLILLALLFGGIGAYHAVAEKSWRVLGFLALGFVPAALPYLFYLVTFGTPNLITATGGASVHAITARKVFEVFFDFNQGVLPYAPVLLLLVLAAVVLAALRRDWLTLALVGVSVGMAVLSAMSTNWDAGSIGLMRYAVWQLPLLGWIVVRVFADTGPVARVALAALVGVQLLVFSIASFSMSFAPSYLANGYLARLVLDSAPGMYSPTPDVFAKRTANVDGDWTTELPIGYATPERQLRKALLTPSQEASAAQVLHVDEAALKAHTSDAGEGLVYLTVPPGTWGQ